ncbi:hypothetical protein PRBRB14_10380 [Hallella multisaccharivorax DSM 17128]|nr:hypothetical protein PRBRB14_10380 [Hallella multisaccharivorax DSM 17128]
MAFSQAWTWEPTEDGRACHGGKFCSYKHTNEEVQHWETGGHIKMEVIPDLKTATEENKIKKNEMKNSL